MHITPPSIIRRLYPDIIWSMENEAKGVFLTFDDGPTPGVTEWILETLAGYDAKATFFMLGKNVELYPDLYGRIISEGHKAGNHTYSHQKGWGMTLEKYIEDVNFCGDVFQSDLFRPPYARVTPSQMRAVGKQYNIIMWDILSRDYLRSISPERCLNGILPHLRPGSIVSFHDSDKSFRNMSHALPHVLERIYSNGWECRTIEL